MMRTEAGTKEFMRRRNWKIWAAEEENVEKGKRNKLRSWEGTEKYDEKERRKKIRKWWKRNGRGTMENLRKNEKQKKMMIRRQWKGREREENVNAIFYIACMFVPCRTPPVPKRVLCNDYQRLKRLLNTECEESFGVTRFKKERKKYTQYPT